MASITEKLLVVAACMVGAVPVAYADVVTLTGQGVTIRYEDRAAELFGAPSLIATSVLAPPSGFAAVARRAAFADAGSAGAVLEGDAGKDEVDSVLRDALPQSFADGVGLDFSLDAAAGERRLQSLLFAGIGLFALIARQRLSALLRAPELRVFR